MLSCSSRGNTTQSKLTILHGALPIIPLWPFAAFPLCTLHTKHSSIRSLLSRSLHLHCSFPQSLSSLLSLHHLNSHSAFLPASSSYLLRLLFIFHVAYYNFTVTSAKEIMFSVCQQDDRKTTATVFHKV